jgi:hypothetical protein
VYVGCFLVLRGCRILIARVVVHKRGASMAARRNAVAVLCWFFVLQFADVAGTVARYNVERWERRRVRAGSGISREPGPSVAERMHVARATRNRETAATATLNCSTICSTNRGRRIGGRINGSVRWDSPADAYVARIREAEFSLWK